MISKAHANHLAKNSSWNNCRECRADTERRFVPSRWPGYQYVSDYLGWIKPRLEAIRFQTPDGQSPDARAWQRDFLKALHRRITLKGTALQGRKWCDSYLERMGQFGNRAKAVYLREFAKAGASAIVP